MLTSSSRSPPPSSIGQINRISRHGADPNIEWQSNADPLFLLGAASAGAFARSGPISRNWPPMWKSRTFTPRDFCAGIDFIVVMGHTKGRMKRSGGRFEDEWAHFFQIIGGKVVSFREYFDTHAVVQAYVGGDIHSVGLPAGTECPRNATEERTGNFLLLYGPAASAGPCFS